MPYTLRPAVESDVSSILRLVRALATYEKSPGSVEATEALLHQNLFATGHVANAVLAVDDGTQQAVGMALYFFNFSTWTGKRGIYLEDLFVDESHRKAGLGKRLFAFLAEIAEKECGPCMAFFSMVLMVLVRDCPRMDWTVLKWNEPSIKFYESIGAKAKTEWDMMRIEGEALKALRRLA